MKELDLIKNKNYLLACSYGPDSMALFYLLEKQGFSFEVAIVNYHLRKESDLECKKLEEYCALHNKKVHILDFNEPIKGNIEEECRQIRYEYFSMLCKNENLDGVIVAHHQDDLLETYLMQKSRHNCPMYYGLKSKTTIFGVEVYRPLLDMSKDEIMNLCEKHNIPYMIDKSNLSDDFLRNKIRHSIVSKMSTSTRNLTLQSIEEDNNKLARMLASINMAMLHDVSYMLRLDEVTFQYAINMLKSRAGNYPAIGEKQAKEIRKILKSKKPNVTAHISKELDFVKAYEECYFSKVESHNNYIYTINGPSKIDTPYFYLDCSKDGSKQNIKPEDYPLTIRNIKENDKSFVSGYAVSVNRLMIDWKVPASIRKVWPVFVNKDGQIIYVPRYQKGFKITNETTFYVKLK